MLTKKDITYLETTFATKDELADVKNEILNFKDVILGEIKGMREELTIVIGYRQMIEDHDERIVSLENHLPLGLSKAA